MSVNENVGSVTLTVTRSGGSASEANVNYETQNGTASAGTDYTTTSGTANWADGNSDNKTIAISILNRPGTQGSRTFTVNLSGASGASLGNTYQATVTILADQYPINDYDGDGKSDLAVYQNGCWYIRSVANGSVLNIVDNWGGPGWPPVR